MRYIIAGVKFIVIIIIIIIIISSSLEFTACSATS